MPLEVTEVTDIMSNTKQWRPPPVEASFKKDFGLLKLHLNKNIEAMISEAFREYTTSAFEKIVEKNGDMKKFKPK